MAILCLDNASVTINSVDLSDHVKSIEIPVDQSVVETTAMSSVGWRTKKGTLRDFTVSITMLQDYAASNVDATLWAAFIGTASVPIIVIPVNAAVTATNPSFTGNIWINDYKPISGSPGELSEISMTWTSDGGLTRATS